MPLNNPSKRPVLPQPQLRGGPFAPVAGGTGHLEQALFLETLRDLSGHDPEEVLVLTAPAGPDQQVDVVVLYRELLDLNVKPGRVLLQDFRHEKEAEGLTEASFC